MFNELSFAENLASKVNSVTSRKEQYFQLFSKDSAV